MKKRFFDIQMFDEANLNTNVTTDPGMSAEMKTYYDKELIRLAGPNLVHDQDAQKRDIPKHGGKTVEFRQYESLPKAMTPLVEGVTPKGSKVTATAKTATVDQYGDYASVSDVLDLTSIDNTILEYTDVFGSQAGRTLDSITRDALAGGTNVFYAGGKTSRAALAENDNITVQLIKRVVAHLKAMNAPKFPDGTYHGVIHPYVSFDLMSDPEWVDAHKYASPEEIYNGEIGKIGGVRFKESSEAKIFKGVEDNTPDADTAVFSTLIYGQNAYGTTKVEGGGLEMIVKPRGAGEDPLNQRSSVGWKALKVSERLIEQYMARIESLATDSKNVEAN